MKNQYLKRNLFSFFYGIETLSKLFFAVSFILIIVYTFFYLTNSTEVKIVDVNLEKGDFNMKYLDSCVVNINVACSNRKIKTYKAGCNIKMVYEHCFNENQTMKTGINNTVIVDHIDLTVKMNLLFHGVFDLKTYFKQDSLIVPYIKSKYYDNVNRLYVYNVGVDIKKTTSNLLITKSLNFRDDEGFQSVNLLTLRNISDYYLVLNINELPSNNNIIKINYSSPMNFINLYPEPDDITSSELIYYKKEKIDFISKKGLCVYSESIMNKGKQNMRGYVLSTILGFLFSLLITICGRIYSIKHSKK